MIAVLVSVLVAAFPLDAPLAQTGAAVGSVSPSETPPSLTNARRLSDDLRFEESLVEYNRYLGLPERPSRERAQALFELGYIHLLLNDEVNAERRALEALELHPTLALPPNAPAKQTAFLERAKSLYVSRPRLEVVPRAPGEPASRVSARVADPLHQVRALLLRHGLSAQGPFQSAPMRCGAAGDCVGTLPAPARSNEYTAWYFLEGLDAEGNVIARAGSPSSPLQLAVREEDPWFRNPLVWAAGSAIVVGAAGVFFVVAGSAGAGR